jgi:flagellar biosynthesis protein FliR
LFFAVIGIVGRLVPQLHILFVTQPAQIVGGLAAMVFVLSATMQWFLDAFIRQFLDLTGG